jgi:hypothetical protein
LSTFEFWLKLALARAKYKGKAMLKPVHNCSHTYIFFTRLESYTFLPKKNQTAVETDKFTKVHQRRAMFDFVCN